MSDSTNKIDPYAVLSRQFKDLTGSVKKLKENHDEFKSSVEGGTVQQITQEVKTVNLVIESHSDKQQ
ncbi:hypothetical protein BN7_2548 [Wickerhamomyces ciferrii]|uniref:Uncharacterized protein n=1 Tax=Wickerhamomyces ciferrii (strain ATCC 14091 / BCRC 22168 / CBS 111 / JCM 3599 / NBRC 0793 / NRRL Y-1031 F-60-10) TaxID=1206466 RepID=K0KJ54_WICCF|nr:uncharacterized protein BN7_2548 [Wickerhamomyces ciferrii]CCH43001.1 hypothetical protein BN7_2548 [Wickerhamomyces ciferrii]